MSLSLRTLAALAVSMLAMAALPSSNAEITSMHHLQQADLLYKEFTSFQQQYNRSYLSEDEHHNRLAIFRSNYERILAHNAAADRGEQTYWLKATSFMDRTVEEYQLFLVNVTSSSQTSDSNNLNIESAAQPIQLELAVYDSAYTAQSLPAHVDWRQKGVAGPVRDQGQCGSCWAFATVNSVAATHAWKTGKPFENLSVQELVDCAKGADGTAMTCGTGGTTPDGINWLVSKKIDLVPESSYAYTAADGTCQLSSMQSTLTTPGAVSVKGYGTVTSGDEHALKVAIFQRPMLSVAMDASASDFMLYSHGLYKSTTCKSDDASLDHAVTLTGYGTDAKFGDYWLVKNSWAESWGESGYFRIARNANNMCGIATDAYYPTL